MSATQHGLYSVSKDSKEAENEKANYFDFIGWVGWLRPSNDMDIATREHNG